MKGLFGASVLLTLSMLSTPVAFAQDPAHTGAPENPSSAKECATCHFRWVDTFFKEGRGSDLAPYQKQKVAADPRMCLSCHDGSVVDSRAKLRPGTGHQTGNPPPPGMTIPEEYPLDESGNVVCATCHTAHGVAGDADQGETVFMRTTNKDSFMCVTCHVDKLGGLEAGNHPLGDIGPVPDGLRRMGAKSSKEHGEVICESCHTAHGSPYGKMLIDSVSDSSLCRQCHTDKVRHSEKPRAGELPTALTDVGAELNDEGQLMCVSCHDIHGNDSGAPSLLRLPAEGSKLCVACHPSKQEVQETKHDLTLTAPKEPNIEGQTVKTGGLCSPCHLAHGPARKKGDDLGTDLCISCHGRSEFAKNSALLGYQHPLGVKHEGEPVTCGSCHDPHREGAEGSAFLDLEGSQTCAECHTEKRSIEATKHDLVMVAPTEENARGLTAEQTGTCRTCHLVHSETRDRWATEPVKKSEGDVERMCLGCHSKGRVAKEEALEGFSHPVDVSPSEQGLTTTLPLLDSRGQDRMTCATCHDVHQWSVVDPLPDDAITVEGNARSSFLRMEVSPNPRLCENCHAGQATVEGTDHDLQNSAPQATNIMDATPETAGTCGMCHVAHNSESDLLLWAQPPPAQSTDDRMSDLCVSCHSEGRSAATAVPSTSVHPTDAVSNAGRTDPTEPTYLPLYDPETGEMVGTSSMSCSTCHDVHQWNPLRAEKGEGQAVEGDAMTSFLRAGSGDFPCRDCHGKESLFLFKYFHRASSRR